MISINVSDKQTDGTNHVEVKVEGERMRCMAQLVMGTADALKNMGMNNDSEGFVFCMTLLHRMGLNNVADDIMLNMLLSAFD